MPELSLRLSTKPFDFTKVEAAILEAVADSIVVEAEETKPPAKYPAALFVPRHLKKAADALQLSLGPKQLLIFQVGESVTGHRLSSITIWKHSMDEVEEDRFNMWLDGNVKMRLVKGCERNLRIVEL